MTESESRLNQDLLRPLSGFRPGLLIGALLSGAVMSLLFVCWGYQIFNDIGVAGINRPVFWGFYITNLVFWIGISHAGTLISAILRVTSTEWRRPVTRSAEAITVFALSIGGLFPIIHLGRPWLVHWILPFPNDRQIWPNFRSPLVWDVAAITTYLIGSNLYLLLPLIPDLAIVRDLSSGFKRRFYGLLALGWKGTPQQWHSLEKGIHAMAVVIIPVAVSVHTVVAWDFAMTLQPMWHSTVFGPYFVVGAIYSGIAILLVAMALLRAGLGLGEYLSNRVFSNLGLLLLTMSLLWGYFTFLEHLTVWYGNQVSEMVVFQDRISGRFSFLFWLTMVLNFVIPVAVLPFRLGRRPLATGLVGVSILVGMWLERFLIIIPSLSNPRLAYTVGEYSPSWVEWGILAGSFGMFFFLYFTFVRLVPIVSIWEVRENLVRENGRERDGRGQASLEREAEMAARDGVTQSLLEDEESLRTSLESLVDSGLDSSEIEIRSSIPLEQARSLPGVRTRSRIPLIAISGGVLGGLAAFLLVSFTATDYPIVTGGMPIVPALPLGIITYEGTALGAILATVIGVFLEGGLPRFRHRVGPLDHHVAEGRILLSNRSDKK